MLLKFFTNNHYSTKVTTLAIYEHVLYTDICFVSGCSCGNCQQMPTDPECMCCQEIHQVLDELQHVRAPNDSDPAGCILDHPGFNAVCLNIWVLETAWLQYRSEYREPYERTHSQAVPAYCVQTVCQDGVEVFGKTHQSTASCLCCENHQSHIPSSR